MRADGLISTAIRFGSVFAEMNIQTINLFVGRVS